MTLNMALSQRQEALKAIDALKYLTGTIESGSVSHFCAIYDVAHIEHHTKQYVFLESNLAPASLNVLKELSEKTKKVKLDGF
jgi:hypothetical protein